MKRLLALCMLFVALTFVGDVEAKKFKWVDARQIRAGMTTEEVTRLMGTPNAVSASGDTVRYVWVHVSVWTFATRSLSVDFKNGKVVQAPVIPAEFK